jgi:hypothetical protein
VTSPRPLVGRCSPYAAMEMPRLGAFYLFDSREAPTSESTPRTVYANFALSMCLCVTTYPPAQFGGGACVVYRYRGVAPPSGPVRCVGPCADHFSPLAGEKSIGFCFLDFCHRTHMESSLPSLSRRTALRSGRSTAPPPGVTRIWRGAALALRGPGDRS